MTSSKGVVFTGVVPLDSLKEGEVELAPFLVIAHEMITTQSWTNKILNYWFGISIPNIVGVFLYEIQPNAIEIPNFHWVVVGTQWPYPERDENGVDQNEIENANYSGLPNAYIWTGSPDFDGLDAAPTPLHALNSYCGVVMSWIQAVHGDGDLTKEYPVEIPANKSATEYADDIETIILKIDDEYLRPAGLGSID